MLIQSVHFVQLFATIVIVENPNEVNIVANEKSIFEKDLKAVQIGDKSTLALIDTASELYLLR